MEEEMDPAEARETSPNFSLPHDLHQRVPSLERLCADSIATSVDAGLPSRYFAAASESACIEVLDVLRSRRTLSDDALSLFSPTALGHGDYDKRWRRGALQIHRFNLSYSDVSDFGLAEIAHHHPIVELNLSGCHNTARLFDGLLPCAPTLRVLNLNGTRTAHGEFYNSHGIMPANPGLAPFASLKELGLSQTRISLDGLRAIPPGVEWLDLSETDVDSNAVHCGLEHLTDLAYLNLSGTQITYDTIDEEGIPGTWYFFEYHRGLRGLDIGMCPLLKPDGHTQIPFDFARRTFFAGLGLCEDLEWLNVSALLLCGDSFAHIFGLPALQFLGAFQTNLLEDEVPDGLRVAAHFTPDQVHAALDELGTSSVSVAREALRALFGFLSPHGSRDSAGPAITRDDGFTSLVIRILERFQDDSDVQCFATANLFYLTASTTVAEQSPRVRLKALHALLQLLIGLIVHPPHETGLYQDVQVVKNCCLTLRNFAPETELSRCSCLVAITLLRAALDIDDRTVQHVALLMCCHNLASLHPHHKERIGSAEPESGVTLVLKIIAAQQEELEYAEEVDDNDFIILELGWTFLWNMTDETPSNVQRFLELNGMQTLLESLTTFPDQVALRRNIMGLVTNIAEVTHFRSHLLEADVLFQLETCMRVDADRLEVSYNVAGTLCHILAEGEEYWFAHGQSAEQRQQLLAAIAAAVTGWDKATERWINYRSLQPIINLLGPSVADEVYLWATWALLSLCTVTPGKYCTMLEEEGGLERLDQLSKSTHVSEQVAGYAAETLIVCDEWERGVYTSPCDDVMSDS
mmetsp:Transcript_26333/g.79107  ORF Transcript_26333/g.79107 Transcript_26333/m.79107 type:complete len:806 (+) Transcript_26333:330-2747(+)